MGMALILQIILLILLLIELILIMEDISEHRIKGVYTWWWWRRLDWLIMALNPRKYFEKDYIMEGSIALILEFLIICGIVYLMFSLAIFPL